MPTKPTLATASRTPDLSNLRAVYNFLTTGIEKYTGGKGKNLSPNAALGLMGNWTHESGDPYLANTANVKEAGGKGPGVGIQQYTEPARKSAYQSWLSSVGGKPSTLQQAQYAMQEYYGPNRNLIGWTRALESLPPNLTAQQYAKYFSDKLLRPGTPHVDRRMSEAQRLNQLLNTKAKVNTPQQQGDYNPPSVGKQGPVFDPSKWVNTRYQPNASAAKPVVIPFNPPPSIATTTSQSNIGRLPGLGELAQWGIGNLKWTDPQRRTMDQYGRNASSLNTSSINAQSWGSNTPNLGKATGITSSPSYQAATNSGYTWAKSAPAASSWRQGFGLV